MTAKEHAEWLRKVSGEIPFVIGDVPQSVRVLVMSGATPARLLAIAALLDSLADEGVKVEERLPLNDNSER